MINLGTEKIKINDDGWTFVTLDGLQSAHFEHNIAVIDSKPELLSTFRYIYQALGIESNEEDKFHNFLIDEIYIKILTKRVTNKI